MTQRFDQRLKIVQKGAYCTVAYAPAADGRLIAKEFLDSNEVPVKDKARLAHWMIYVAQYGWQGTNRTVFKKQAGEIWAFKAYQTRVGAFWFEGVLFLTHGFIKKNDDWPDSELVRANRIRQECISCFTPATTRR